jgi:hypothetical protein
MQFHRLVKLPECSELVFVAQKPWCYRRMCHQERCKPREPQILEGSLHIPEKSLIIVDSFNLQASMRINKNTLKNSRENFLP